MFFGSKTILIHLLKGILGLAALYIAIRTMNTTLWLSFILLPAVLFLWKG